MIEKISIAFVNESGAQIEIVESELSKQSRLDIVIAETFSAIVCAQQSIADDEIRTDEKFRLALNLKNFLKEWQENAEMD